MHRPTAVVSIDADFFTCSEEQRLRAPLVSWLGCSVTAGVPVWVSDDHVDLVEALPRPVDVIVNFDFHMDMTLDFLLGAPAARPADASVFESLVADRVVRRYLWAHPVSRRKTAARIYTSALLAGRQPLLGNVHCMSGVDAMAILDELDVVWAFVCRSPGYATTVTDAAFADLVRVSGSCP